MSTRPTQKKPGCLSTLVIIAVLIGISFTMNAVNSAAPKGGARERTGRGAAEAPVVLLPTVTPTPRPPTPTPDPSLPRTDIDARVACMTAEDFVTPNLKAPATAEFSSFEESCRAYFAAGVWTIRSYVDSQNAFGAMIRTNYVAKLTYAAHDESWHLQDLVFSAR